MSRTPNDDRSDAMNPNSDAYAADQENRYGDDYLWDDDDVVAAMAAAPPRDTRFGPDPHPILGRRSNRLPGLSRSFQIARPVPKIPMVVPWTETLALAFATDETEARDRKLALDEFMTVTAWLFEQASKIAVRQGHTPAVESVSDEKIAITFRLDDKRSLAVCWLGQFDLVSVGGAAFRFAQLRWRSVDLERSSRRVADEIVGYRRPIDLDASADPAQAVVDRLDSLGGRRQRYGY
jgi:hypothetical protein